MVGAGKYRICAFGDWTVKYQLALEALRGGTTLPESVSSNFVNLLELHYDQNPTAHCGSLEELLKLNELEPIANDTKAKTDGASIVRILNRMIRTAKTRFDGQGMANTNESTEESKTEVKRDRSRSRSRDGQESTDGKYHKRTDNIFSRVKQQTSLKSRQKIKIVQNSQSHQKNCHLISDQYLGL